MKLKKFLCILALLCTIVQGAWAQVSWDEVYAMTNTITSDWAQLSAGSATGRTLGAAGTTTFYYANSDLTFTNSNAGGSGLTIQGIVYLYVPQGVTVTCTGANASGQTNYVDFVGTYCPVSIYTAEKTNLYLGADNTLYYPTDDGFKVNAFRGYFQLKQGLKAGDTSSGVRAFKLNFGDDVTTSVTTPLALGRGAGGEAWYSLDGRKLSGRPSRAGVYINNGVVKVNK